MSLLRASNAVIRSTIRPAATLRPLTLQQTRTQSHMPRKENLGGPGGQQPPPQSPGGPEAMKRYWVPIGGAALLAVAAYAYMTRNPDQAKQMSKEAQQAGHESVRVISGQKKTGLGGFRNE